MSDTIVHTITIPFWSVTRQEWVCVCRCGREATGVTAEYAAAALMEHVGYTAWPIV